MKNRKYIPKALFEQAKTNVFNAISLGNIVEDKLIFSDRLFLTEQILWERHLYGNKGFNEISDFYFIMLCMIGKIKTMKVFNKENRK